MSINYEREYTIRASVLVSVEDVDMCDIIASNVSGYIEGGINPDNIMIEATLEKDYVVKADSLEAAISIVEEKAYQEFRKQSYYIKNIFVEESYDERYWDSTSDIDGIKENKD